MARKLKAYKMSEEILLQKLGIDNIGQSTVSIEYNVHMGIVIIHTTEHYGLDLVEGAPAQMQMDMGGYWTPE